MHIAMAPEHQNGEVSKKRKRSSLDTRPGKVGKNSRQAVPAQPNGQDSHIDILELEKQIQESPKHYNNIATLLAHARDQLESRQDETKAIVALCRVFSRLTADGRLRLPKAATEKQLIVNEWLGKRYTDYIQLILDILKDPQAARRQTALTLGMQLVREEVMSDQKTAASTWRTGTFATIMTTLLDNDDMEIIYTHFIEEFVQRYEDVRCYTFAIISDHLKDAQEKLTLENCKDNGLGILSAIDIQHLTSKKKTPKLFCESPEGKTASKITQASSKKQAQYAWLALLNAGLDKDQRKAVLRIMTYRVVPCFLRVELLMDFLTDSYNVGGATSLLALSGLFHLMQEKNLDYPDFYSRLYSLLDNNLLHSKHRSRFFRLLNIFMSSSHLPAAMVASFIKRLSRLALLAPPAAIVAVIPWVYNMLKAHPTCTFMIHRETQSDVEREFIAEYGFIDPFKMDVEDPMETFAIESSLWELSTLQTHYHPNVASVARIISEQFTKNSYNIEDFLDHSYHSLIESDLKKNLRNPPALEYEIPKRIFADSHKVDMIESIINRVISRQRN